MKKKSSISPKILKKLPKINDIKISVTNCGLKNNNKDDLVLIKLPRMSKIFGFFTDSKMPGESIKWNRSIIKYGKVSAILINSGNANVFNGIKGERSQEKIINEISQSLKISKKEIYIASTGVIGELLDEKKIIKSIPKLISELSCSSEVWYRAANAIRTTDTFPKLNSKIIALSQNKIKINGIAKGSGMVSPNMATMLAFIFTDANFKHFISKKKIQDLVDKTFNSISVDGDKSTSDMFLFISVNSKVEKYIEKKEIDIFLNKLQDLMEDLAIQIVRDGEGAKKLIEINISGTNNNKDAKMIAMSIANSLLFKTAMAGSDGNWGRVIMAIGKTGVEIEPKKLSIRFGKLIIILNGERCEKISGKSLDKYLQKDKIQLFVTVGLGKGFCKVWTCDLTKEYISINADYRS